jgi:receptor expression-enhancing protein 5/6
MALLGSALGGEVGLRLLLSPATSHVIVRTACTVVGIGFPVYSTHKAIERKSPAEQERWLVYWAVYGCFSVAEVFSDQLLSWCPFYYHVKFVFLVWLQLPSSSGSQQLYISLLRPILLKHQAKLDRIVDGTRNEMVTILCSLLVCHASLLILSDIFLLLKPSATCHTKSINDI